MPGSGPFGGPSSTLADMTPLERPSWADDPRLAICGFETRHALGPEAVSNVVQEHGTEVHLVATAAPPQAGDGLWTTTPELPIAIRVADCVPILLWDPVAGAVAAVHAGWRGTAANIVAAAFAAATASVVPSRVFAAIGPCISVERFEVGPEVVEGLRGAGLSDEQLRLRTGPSGKPHVDLRSANRALLRRAGVPDDRIEDVGGCTMSDERYESYRRDGPRSRRQRGIIALAGV